MNEWVRMPTNWIQDELSDVLRNMRWIGRDKSDQIAALMIYVVLVQHANNSERCSVTYTRLEEILGLSRAKIAGGLKVLLREQLIDQVGSGRKNVYKICDYNEERGWGKLPTRGLYDAPRRERIGAFHHFKLRVKNELNAMKLYLLIVAFRSNRTNYAHISYPRITDYTGIPNNEIRSAISLLINLELIEVDFGYFEEDGYRHNKYRLRHLESYRHRGTMPDQLTTTL